MKVKKEKVKFVRMTEAKYNEMLALAKEDGFRHGQEFARSNTMAVQKTQSNAGDVLKALGQCLGAAAQLADCANLARG